MYEFVTHTWNPLGGKCPHGCSYCSTNKFHYPVLIEKYSGPPRLIEDELKTNFGDSKFIFVCAQHDLFAEDIQDDWIAKILDHCEKFRNRYLFQTKNPINFHVWGLPMNSVICTTIESNRWYPKIMNNTPHPRKRAEAMSGLIKLKKYVTIEPIMDFDLEEMVEMIEWCMPLQVNIGADSGNNNLPEPSKEKILALISELEKFTKVVQKSNLDRLI